MTPGLGEVRRSDERGGGGLDGIREALADGLAREVWLQSIQGREEGAVEYDDHVRERAVLEPLAQPLREGTGAGLATVGRTIHHTTALWASTSLRSRAKVLVDPEGPLIEPDRKGGAAVRGKGLDAAFAVASATTVEVVHVAAEAVGEVDLAAHRRRELRAGIRGQGCSLELETPESAPDGLSLKTSPSVLRRS